MIIMKTFTDDIEKGIMSSLAVKQKNNKKTCQSELTFSFGQSCRFYYFYKKRKEKMNGRKKKYPSEDLKERKKERKSE